MKKITLLLLLSITTWLSVAQDCSVTATLPYVEDFLDGAPACWTFENTDAMNPAWVYNNGIDLTGNGTNDPFAGLIPNNISNTQKNDWAFTQKVQMDAGTTYQISVDYNSLGLGNAVASENFELVITNAANSTASFSEVIGTYNNILQQGSFPGSAGNNVKDNAYTAQEEFTPTTSGEYYVAIHALGTNGSDSGVFMVFNTTVDEAPLVCNAQTVPYTEDFLDGAPACWTFENTDAMNPAWVYNNGIDLTGNGTNDPFAGLIPNNISNTQKNDWAFTQKVQMDAGTTYQISVDYNSLGLGNAVASENFELVITNAANSTASFSEVIGTYNNILQQGSFPGSAGNNVKDNAYTAQEDFTPTTSGEYYVAIHALGTNGSDSGVFMVFNTTVDEAPLVCNAQTVPYLEDFENGDPACWSYENTDNVGPEWMFNLGIDIDGDGSNDPMLSIIPPSIQDVQKDDWAFTDKIQMQAGTPYFISAHYNTVNLGTATAFESFELVVLDAPSSNAPFINVLETYTNITQQGSFPGNNDGQDLESMAYFTEKAFTPQASGEYYIAIHATGSNGTESAPLLLFDFAVNETPIGPDCTDAATIPYSEDFSNGTPECWEYENTDAIAPEWAYNDGVDVDGDGTNDTILNLIPNNTGATAKDDWAFSKKIALNANAEYQIIANYNALNLGNNVASESFELVITDAPNSNAIVEVLGTYTNITQQGTFPGNNDGNDLESQAYVAQELFTPTTTGEYYLAIHATGSTGTDAGGFLLFNVRIENFIAPSDGELILFPNTTISGVNGNGSAATGYNASELLVWNEPTGVELIGGAIPQTGTGGDVKISNDGATVVGPYVDPSTGLKVMSKYDVPTQTWTPLGGIGGQSGDQISSAWGISGDAETVVGLGWLNGGAGAHAISWNEATGVVDLGSTVPGASSRANAVSEDGTVISGWQDSASGFRQAAVWTNGVQQLITFPNGDPALSSGSISDDGNWVGGDGSFANSFQAYRWSEATGIESLGPPLSPGWRGATTALSSDGSVVVGFYRPQGPAIFGNGFIWTETLGVIDLNTYAEALGIDTQGTTLSLPLDISADGSTIVGAGRDSNNQRVGFILKLSPTVLGVDDPGSSNEVITYYPNPINDIVNINSINGFENISIYNITGSKVLELSMTAQSTQSINVSGLASGIYIAQLESDGVIKTIKLIKK